MPGTNVVPSFKGTPVQEWARALVDHARVQAEANMQVVEGSAPTAASVDVLKHALASGVARALAENDKFVRAVYAYDPAPPQGAAANHSTIHLLVLVAKPSAALEAFIATLDRALVTQLQNLGHLNPRDSVLDVNLFTPEDVRRGVGYAALLHSMSPPPKQLWQREIST